jgi:hypothetical protein
MSYRSLFPNGLETPNLRRAASSMNCISAISPTCLLLSRPPTPLADSTRFFRFLPIQIISKKLVIPNEVRDLGVVSTISALRFWVEQRFQRRVKDPELTRALAPARDYRAHLIGKGTASAVPHSHPAGPGFSR